MADTLDLMNRDPNNVNSHVQVAFEDVLSEPDGIKSMDCVWKLSYSCFEGGKHCIYKFLTLFYGICIALEWGCVFGILAFRHIWCYTPILRVCSIECGCCSKLYGVCLPCLCEPLTKLCGDCFGRCKSG